MDLGAALGSTVKGLLTGFATGYFQSKLRSLPLGILFGLAVGFALSFAVAATAPDPEGRYYHAEIILPGSVLGAIVGCATYRFGLTPQAREIA